MSVYGGIVFNHHLEQGNGLPVAYAASNKLTRPLCFTESRLYLGV